MPTFYCTLCAAPSSSTRPTLDPRFPLVLCATEWHFGGWHPGVPTAELARASMAAWTRSEALRKHRGHIASGRITSCPVCAELPANTQPART